MDSDQSLVITVKDRQMRKQLMEEILAFKKQIAGFYHIMKKDVSERIENSLIAELNDFAYKAIRKTGI